MENNPEFNIRIFEIIMQLQDLIEESPRPKFGGNSDKRIVDVSEINDILGDMKVVIPEDVRRANSVLIEADKIISGANSMAESTTSSAEERAAAMLEDAQVRSHDMVSKAQDDAKQIVADAQQRARETAENAQREYERLISENSVFTEACRRAEIVKDKAEQSANMVFDNAQGYADDVLNDLSQFIEQYLSMIERNRAELGAHNKQREQQMINAQNQYRARDIYGEHEYTADAQESSPRRSQASRPVEDEPAEERHEDPRRERVKQRPAKRKPAPKYVEEDDFDDDFDDDDDFNDDEPLFSFLRPKKKKHDRHKEEDEDDIFDA